MPVCAKSLVDHIDSFVCDICSKRFVKRLSRNRHRLYCRKKSLNGRPYRNKPCLPCRQAKTKCSSDLPYCTRCGERKIACIYDKQVLQTAKDSRSTTETSLSSQVLLEPDGNASHQSICGLVSSSTLRGIQARGSRSSLSENLTYGTENTSLIEFNESGDTEFIDTALLDSNQWRDWDSTNDPGSGRGLLHEHDIILDAFLCADTPTSLTFAFDTTSIDESNSFFDSPYLKLRYIITLHHSTSPCSSITRQNSPFNPTSRSAGSQLGQSFILQNLQSYPEMLLDSEATHPFIYPNQRSPFTDDLPESLAICQNIVLLHTMKTKQTTAFIWRTIALERERLHHQYQNSDEKNLIAMLQALTVYIILRISTDLTSDVLPISSDHDLIQTMTAVAIKLEGFGFLGTAEILNDIPLWEDWILMESKRRTVTILFIIHLLFDINPGQRTKAFSGLCQLPLPAYKSIWSAPTEDEWKTHYETWLRHKEGRPPLSYGDLVHFGFGRESDDTMKKKDLDSWLVNVDSLAMLLMMAANNLSI